MKRPDPIPLLEMMEKHYAPLTRPERSTIMFEHFQAIHALASLGFSWNQIVTFLTQLATQGEAFLKAALPSLLRMVANGVPFTQVEQWLLQAISNFLGGNPLPPEPTPPAPATP